MLGLYLFFSYLDQSNLYRLVAFFGLLMAIYFFFVIIYLQRGKAHINQLIYKKITTWLKKFSYEIILPAIIIGLFMGTFITGAKEFYKIIDEKFIGYNYWLFGLLIALLLLAILIIIRRKLSFSTVILVLIFIPIYFTNGFSFINNRFYTAPYQKSFVILEKSSHKKDDEETDIYQVSIRKDNRIIDVMIPKKIWLKKKKKDSIKLELAKGYFGYEFVLKTVE